MAGEPAAPIAGYIGSEAACNWKTFAVLAAAALFLSASLSANTPWPFQGPLLSLPRHTINQSINHSSSITAGLHLNGDEQVDAAIPPAASAVSNDSSAAVDQELEAYVVTLGGHMRSYERRLVPLATQLHANSIPIIPLTVYPNIAAAKFSFSLSSSFSLALELAVANDAFSRGMVLFIEDDTGLYPYPEGEFRAELFKTVNDLPAQWQVLHLCSGFLWGHKKHKKRHGPRRYNDPDFQVP
ncbi:unnamed protein product [Vitrella brassicaformis CCMP3155]|uniref:Uncharacterized protein n=1 Tax=Vitrella brassicaformis (strain CCMP3155) TaxID=1169540 RepID=A0A0G4FDE4_VITBC|nr:unnamed protein product [Vitrella brassicaformis CCMP3155]|eukprot:CEM11218.1 unnamed protein product [Vitrella brassicaformis CCMP3155]